MSAVQPLEAAEGYTASSASSIAPPEDLGLTPTVAITVFMKRFVQDGGFPFDVRKPTPSKSEFIAQMEDRYERMLNGHETEHGLIEE